ncbi:MAG: hypothetical protein HZB16_04105 [Armatimonadetes bacterium]|nr:hypothetical protein [Armatimonadota bacterium]
MGAEPTTGTTRGLRARALILAVPLCILFAYITVYGDMVCKSVQIGILQLPPPAVGALLGVVLLGQLITRLTGRRLLEPRDLLPIYMMLTITVLMSSRGTIEKLIPPTIELNYRATPENLAMQTFAGLLPKWLVAFDPKGPPKQRVAKDYAEGNAPVQWRLWLGPLLSWSGLLVLVYTSFLCLSVILRRQWQDNEKLVFPLTTLPLTLIDDAHSRSFFRNRLMWTGFAVPTVLYLLNGLHANFPPVPGITTRVVINDWLTTRPWNQIQYTPINLSVEAIGFFYFLSGDLLLSLWLFYVYGRVFDMCMVQAGYPSPTMNAHNPSCFSGYQSMGAHLVLLIYLMRVAWPHLKQVKARAFAFRTRIDDGPEREVITYRMAVWGLVLSFGGALVWMRQAGLDWGFGAVQMGMYLFVICFVLGRLVTEAGVLQTETSFRATDFLVMFRAQPTFGARNLAMIGLLDIVLARDPRGLLLTNFLDSQKMAQDLKVRPRSLLLPTIIAIVVAFVAGSYFFLTLSHRDGHVNLYGYPAANAWSRMSNAQAAIEWRVTNPPLTGTMFIYGVGVTSALVFLRAAFAGFPLHPLAYAVHAAWSMNVFWFSAFLAWAIKGFILRAGGMKLYRRLMPFFLGMTLGSFTMACLWTAAVIIGRVKGININPPMFGFD